MPISYKLPDTLSKEALELIRQHACYLDEAITSVAIKNNELQINFSNEADLDSKEGIYTELETLIARTKKSYSKVNAYTVFENTGNILFTNDPMPTLIRSRQAIETVPGSFVLQGNILKVFSRLDHVFRQYALDLGAVEQECPVTVPLSSMIENGYISGFPHHAMLISTIHSDIDSITYAAKGEQKNLEGILSSPDQMLSPTVCYHCFESMRNQNIEDNGVTFTGINKCHRNEGKNINALARLNTFTMREYVFFGKADYVDSNLKRSLEFVKELFVRWGVQFNIKTATDPFFPVSNQSKRGYQSLLALKYEIALKMPFNESEIACGSFNNHKDSLTACYCIRNDTFEPESGCVGIGYERLAYALFCQFGLDLTLWPEALQKDLNL